MIILFLKAIFDIIFFTITYPLLFISLHFIAKDERSFKELYKDMIEYLLEDFLEVLYD